MRRSISSLKFSVVRCLTILSWLVVVALLGATASFAQAPVSIATSAPPVAFNTNNTGAVITYSLNQDGSVSALQFGSIVASGGCPAFLTGAVSNAALYFDSSTKRLYIAASTENSVGQGLGTIATYETVNGNGTCTVGPSVTLSPTSTFSLEINVDTSLGNVYVVAENLGGNLDELYPLALASFPAYAAGSTAIPEATLDYSVTYGPIVLDSSSHRVYINDFGMNASNPAGLNVTEGFFVYDPTHSTTAANNIEHVLGFVNSSNASVYFSAQTLLVDGTGRLILVNQNTSGQSGALGFLTNPFTILDPSKFNFFTDSEAHSGFPSGVLLTPAAGITLVSSANGATLVNYSAYSSADIDTVHGIVYVFAYLDSGSALQQSSGALLTYTLATNKENLVVQNLNFAALPHSSNVAPWDRMIFNPAGSNLVLAAQGGALGVSSQLFNCGTVTISQVIGGGSTYLTLGYAAVNFANGYAYDIETEYPNVTLFAVPPPAACIAAPSLTITPATLADGVAGVPYGPVTIGANSDGQTFAGTTFSATGLPPGMSLSSSGILSGTPTVTGPFEVSIVANAPGNGTGNAVLPLKIDCPTITVSPAQLPGGVVGVNYNVVLTETGGVGTVTFQAFGTFALGLQFNGTTIFGTPNAVGSLTIGIQAKDSNGCLSVNNISTLNLVAPQFNLSPAYSGQCGKGLTGYPIGIPPIVTINNAQYFQVQLNLFNSGNVAATAANMTSGKLGSVAAVNSSAPGAAEFPLLFNNPGTQFGVGACVQISLYFPLSGFPSLLNSVPLRIGGTFTTASNPAVSGPWSLTDARVELGNSVTGGGGPGTTNP